MIHSLDYYNTSVPNIYPREEQFFHNMSDLDFIIFSFSGWGLYRPSEKLRTATIKIGGRHPLGKKIYKIKDQLELKSRLVFENEFPGLMWWAGRHKIKLKEELRKHMQGPYQALVDELDEIKAKGRSRTGKEEERAYMLEWNLIGESWGSTRELRRMIDLPDVEHAMRRYHEDDEVNEK